MPSSIRSIRSSRWRGMMLRPPRPCQQFSTYNPSPSLDSVRITLPDRLLPVLHAEERLGRSDEDHRFSARAAVQQPRGVRPQAAAGRGECAGGAGRVGGVCNAACLSFHCARGLGGNLRETRAIAVKISRALLCGTAVRQGPLQDAGSGSDPRGPCPRAQAPPFPVTCARMGSRVPVVQSADPPPPNPMPPLPPPDAVRRPQRPCCLP